MDKFMQDGGRHTKIRSAARCQEIKVETNSSVVFRYTGVVKSILKLNIKPYLPGY